MDALELIIVLVNLENYKGLNIKFVAAFGRYEGQK